MNILAIDFGTKRLGLAMATNDIISTLPAINNDGKIMANLSTILSQYQITQIYIGLSEGQVAQQSKVFGLKLSENTSIPIEFVEESVSTIEANEIYKANKSPQKKYKSNIDSVAAAVILRRALLQ